MTFTSYPSADNAARGVGGVAIVPRGDSIAEADPAIGAGHDESIPRVFLALADLTVLCVAFLITGAIAPSVRWFLLPSGPLGLTLPGWISLPGGALPDFPPLVSVAWVPLITAPTTVLFMELLGGYRQLADQSRSRLLLSSTLAPTIALSFLTLALFALKMSQESRVLIFTFSLSSVAGLLIYRSSVRLYKKHRLAAGLYAKNVLLVGEPTAVDWMSKHFRQHVPSNRYQLAGWLGVDSNTPFTDSLPATRALDVKQLGVVEDLGHILINRPIHEVIAVQSSVGHTWLGQVIEQCDYFRVRLRIVPEALLVGTLRDLRLVFRSEPLRLPEVVLAPPHLDSEALFLKRLIDIIVSAMMLILLAPLFLLIGIAIKLTTPQLPVFYPWRVIGLKGRPFTGYKFTTMVADAEAKRHDLLAQNEMQGPVFKLRADPRVTPLGRTLRKFSLNELPQLWSVLKGDMSLVGPRPAFRHELDRYELWHKRKLCVKPGITCLWQVRGRNRICRFDDWVRLDLEYIDRWTLWLDTKILARTLWAVVAGTGS